LLERPEQYRRISNMETVARDMGLHGLFSAEGADWRRQRKLIVPAFRDSNISACFPQLQATTERLLRVFARAAQQHQVLDLLHVLMCYTVDVTAAVAFGRDVNTLESGRDELQEQLEVVFPMLLRRVNSPVPYWRYISLPGERRLGRALRKARSIFSQLIAESRSKAGESRPSLLDAMIAATAEDEGSARLSDDELIANMFTLLLAGQDTTASTLAWLLFYMAEEPTIHAQLRVEADALLGSRSTLGSPDDVKDLPWLTATVRETLRLRSPAPFLFLEPICDVVLSGLHVPAGTPIFALTRHAALSGTDGPAPTAFQPARWLSSTSAPPNVRADMTFGAGPRICPGRQLALLESALVVSSVAKHFDLSLVPGSEVCERFDFAMKPQGLQVRFSERVEA
jgi:cytochrome P450